MFRFLSLDATPNPIRIPSFILSKLVEKHQVNNLNEGFDLKFSPLVLASG
jgi:hypothetical protein